MDRGRWAALAMVCATILVAAVVTTLSGPSRPRTAEGERSDASDAAAPTPTESVAPELKTVRVPDEHNIHETRAEPEDDAAKASTIHGILLQALLAQAPNTAGISPDSIHLTFGAPAEIVGILVSVDISADTSIVEVAAAINDDRGYGRSRDADWLIHTSFAASDVRSGNIDESMWFGPGQGFEVDEGDHVAVGAYLVNVASYPSGVSPEVIVYYHWLE